VVWKVRRLGPAKEENGIARTRAALRRPGPIRPRCFVVAACHAVLPIGSAAGFSVSEARERGA